MVKRMGQACHINNQRYRVQHFQYQAALSDCYSLILEIEVRKSQSVFVGAGDSCHFLGVDGVVESISIQESSSKKQQNIILNVVPRLFLLKQHQSQRYFKKMSVESILKSILTAYQKQVPAFEFALRFSSDYLRYYKIPMAFMGEQSDFEYVQELLNYGFCYYFVGNKVVFTDDENSIPETHFKKPVQPLALNRRLSGKIKAIPIDRVPGQGRAGIVQCKKALGRLIYEWPVKFQDKQRNDQKTITRHLQSAIDHELRQLSFSTKEALFMLGRFKSEVIVFISLSGRWDCACWDFSCNFTTRPHITSDLKIPKGNVGFINQYDYMANKALTQVSEKGNYAVGIEHGFRFRDLQLCASQNAGASHASSLGGNSLLASVSGLKHAYICVGALANQQSPNIIRNSNAYLGKAQHENGISVALLHRHPGNLYNQISLQNANTQCSVGGEIGLFESTQGTALYEVCGNYSVNVGEGVYQFDLSVAEQSLKLAINVDSYTASYWQNGKMAVHKLMQEGVIYQYFDVPFQFKLSGAGRYIQQHVGNLTCQHLGPTQSYIHSKSVIVNTQTLRVVKRAKQERVCYQGESFHAKYKGYALHARHFDMKVNELDIQARFITHKAHKLRWEYDQINVAANQLQIHSKTALLEGALTVRSDRVDFN